VLLHSCGKTQVGLREIGDKWRQKLAVFPRRTSWEIMKVSVIIPAFNAHKTLAIGLDSIQQAWTRAATMGVDVEALVSIDDGQPQKYKGLLDRYAFARAVIGGTTGTGPSRARNRAMAVATGDYIAVLDADDSWTGNYLTELLPLARLHGASFGRTEILNENGTTLDIFPRSKEQTHLGLDDISHWSGSFHPIVRRDLMERNILDRAQDVWSAVTTIAKQGGAVPLARNACYQLRLRGGSMTTEDYYAAEVDDSYARLAAHAVTHPTLPSATRPTIQQLWRQKSTHNQQFIAAQATLAAEGKPQWASFYHWRASTI